MKLRIFTGLALVLALGGCASYGYVGDGGGYYTGGSSVEYRYPPTYGGYGYGVYGYGSPYYSYRYTPGWSLGVGYGSPYGYYPRYPYYGGGYYRPPHHHPRPPAHPPRPGYGHGVGPDRPDRPPQHAGGGNPPLDRAPWRDLDHIRDGDTTRPPRQHARPNAMRPDMVPRADGETWQRPSPVPRRIGGPRPDYQGAEGPRHRGPASAPVGSRAMGDAAPRQSPPRMERRMEARGGSRPSASARGYPGGGQSETAATENP